MKTVELEDGQSADIVAENIERLKDIFPDAFTEGGVNFETLRQLLGDAKVLDEGEEKYGLNWHGKKKARQIALTPSAGTLLPCPDESVDWDTTKNLFIEGDNLEVLKLLQKSYANKVKMIYIDPPYNTGGEFIYPDKFQENLDTYLKYTGQVDDEGIKFSSNTESVGRKHTAWLNMMLPRLKLARNLLSKDGFIVISIDDNEVANLRKICDEIFGEENYLSEITWKHTQQSKNDEPFFARVKNSLICYRKTDALKKMRLPRTEEDNKNYSNSDNDPNGYWRSGDVRSPSFRPTLKYDITTPSGKTINPPENGWRWSEASIKEKIKSGEVIFTGDENKIVRKIYLKNQEGRTPENVWLGDRFGTTRMANTQIKELFDGEVPFDTPKPTALIRALMSLIYQEKDYYILDFFAGSSSTAQAVVEQNIEDGGKRKFIMVQLPELVDEKSVAYRLGFKTISDISLDRLRRFRKTLDDIVNIDTGLKLFRLGESNIQAWNPDRADLEESLLSHEEHLVEGRSEQDILYELLLKRGVDLSVPIETREVSGKNIYSIGYGVLFACLDESITSAQVENIAQGIIDWYIELSPSSDTHIFFRDSAFRDDVSKTNMAAILEQNGITHVRSL